MSTDLKADLLRALDGAEDPDLHLDAPWAEELRARVKAATITEPPPPDPCEVVTGTLRMHRPDFKSVLHIDDAAIVKPGTVHINHAEAAALLPALQAFVREGGQQ